MKYLLILLMLLPIYSMAQTNEAQTFVNEVESLSWLKLLDNCESKLGIDTSFDNFFVIFSSITPDGTSETFYPPGLIRQCLKVKLEDIQRRICNAKALTASTDTDALARLNEIQAQFHQKLLELAPHIEARMTELEEEAKAEGAKAEEAKAEGAKAKAQESTSAISRIIYNWKKDELQAWRDTVDIESIKQVCHSSE